MKGKYYYIGPPSDGFYSKEVPPFRVGQEVSVINTGYGRGKVYVSVEGWGQTFLVRIEWLSKTPPDKLIISGESLKKILPRHIDDVQKYVCAPESPNDAACIRNMAELIDSGKAKICSVSDSVASKWSNRKISFTIEVVDTAGGEHE